MPASHESRQLRRHVGPTGTYQVEWIPTDSLHPNPRNPRKHNRKQLRQLAASMRKFGCPSAIVVDDSNMVLAGHGRLAAARLEKWTHVPTIRLDNLTPAQKRAYLIADNRIAELAGWNRELLAVELGELVELLPTEGLDISLTGFETAEIDSLLADIGPVKPEPDDIPPPLPDVPISRSGDLWQLGKHRLLCGDARDPTHFKNLMNGAKASAVLSDPPYNRRVSDISGCGRVQHREFAFASGEMTRKQYRSFLKQTLGNGIRVSVEGAIHLVFIDWRHIADLIEVADELYGTMLNLVVWNKTNAGQGSFYKSQHELIGMFRVGDHPHRNNVQLGRFGRNRSNVWTYAGVNTFGRGRDEALASHPTVKPIALVADALLDCTARGDIVLDQFAGSGTTIMAAEKVGRIGFGIEYEPAYVDVAIKRWQAITKLEALLAGDGRTFDEIGTARINSSETTHRRSYPAAQSSTVVRNQSRDATGKRSSSPPKRPRISTRSRGRNG